MAFILNEMEVMGEERFPTMKEDKGGCISNPGKRRQDLNQDDGPSAGKECISRCILNLTGLLRGKIRGTTFKKWRYHA